MAKRKDASKCPMCGKTPVEAFVPFCSARCSKLDLGRWFKEGYKIEIPDSPDSAESLPNLGENDDK